MLTLVTLPALNDNYIWLVHDYARAVVVDPGETPQVLRFLQDHHLDLDAILCTHHHGDHTAGIMKLREVYPSAQVYAPYGDRFAGFRTVPVAEPDTLEILGHRCQILNVPGHTCDHIAYHLSPWLFCGDTLFGAGCGRIFDGDARSFYQSLQKISQLPDDTLVCCAHEYTLANLRFAQAVMPDNQMLKQRIETDAHKREQLKPTIPSLLLQEKETNPFLRCHTTEVKHAVSLHTHQAPPDAADVFALLRQWKDTF